MAKRFPTRSQITVDQLAKLRQLGRAISTNRFYRNKLRHGLELSRISSLESFFAEIPFTTKQEVASDQLKKPPYGTDLTYPLDRYVRFHQTSGTTGVPIRWLDTPESWQWMVESWKKIFVAAGIKGGETVLFTFSFGPFIGFWLAYEAAEQLGCLSIPGGGLGSEARLKLMLENKASVLCCTPTYAIRLAEVAAEAKIDLRRAPLRKILVAGEPGGSIPATRQRLNKLWPTAQVFDHHGMTEVGPVTYECPRHPGRLHVIESAYIAEIVDPTSGQPVPAGEAGELVLTTLGRVGSPLIRYRTGDLVQASLHKSQRGVCSCGTHELALQGGILGRVDDMLIVRGVNIFPSAVESILRGFSEIEEYRVLVKANNALTELQVEVEPHAKSKSPADLAGKVANALQTTFNLRIPVTVVKKGALPRFEMKAKRWVKDTG